VTGALTALRATDGKLMWSWKTPNGIQAVPVTYMIKGVQYVAVSTGAGGGPLGGDKDARARQGGRMVVFRLNGTGVMPPDPDLAPVPQPSDEKFSEAQVKAGQATFNRYCSRCHGGNGVNSNVIPDVRRSPIVNDKDAWHAVVIDGALLDGGMVSWKDFVTDEQAEAMRAFIHGEAVKLAATGARHDQTVQEAGAAAVQ
jgi:mono/diheme cytochrome c family protein